MCIIQHGFAQLTLPLLEAVCYLHWAARGARPLGRLINSGCSVLSIGEFSRASGLTVKTLRFYHEKGLLVPACIDEQSGYRYYTQEQLETARVIALLRSLELPLAEIGEILRGASQGDEALQALERHRASLDERIRSLRSAVRSLDQFIDAERKAIHMTQQAFEVQEKSVEPMLVAAVRMRGKYCDCGRGFAKIGRAFGRQICGPCFLLHYDCEYREDDADFEACMPVRVAKKVDGVSVRELPGGRCVALVHKGPYEQLGRSYARVLDYACRKQYEIVVPTREVYVKGPGMIFKGNPKNYLTEIQMMVS